MACTFKHVNCPNKCFMIFQLLCILITFNPFILYKYFSWGTLSTTSVHLNGQAWGQPKSFVDGPVNNSTGNLYFYDSDMDTSLEVQFTYYILECLVFFIYSLIILLTYNSLIHSFVNNIHVNCNQDIAANPNVAFSLSMTQNGLCHANVLDPESPVCARVVISGKFVDVTDADEVDNEIYLIFLHCLHCLI